MIINLTQHLATTEQKRFGVVDVEDEHVRGLTANLTFDEIPSEDEMYTRAANIAYIANQYKANCAMIGGAPYFMRYLEATLIAAGIKPLYAFSRRESVESVSPDGSVVKTNVFRHIGFVEA